MRNMYQMFVVTVSWINEILKKKKIWLVVIGIDLLQRHILQNGDLCLFFVFDKPHLYHFRNKEIIPFLGKEKQRKSDTSDRDTL